MSEPARAESPLEGVKSVHESDLALEAVPLLGYLNLRGRPDERLLEAVAGVCGLSLPVEANTVASHKRLRALWLGPDEWLLVTAPGEQHALMHALTQAVDGLLAGVTDVSGYYMTLTVSGGQTRALLARGCPLDLHARAFGPQRCAQSLLAKAGVILEQIDDTPRFRLIMRRSLADYVWRWLQDALRGLDTGRAV